MAEKAGIRHWLAGSTIRLTNKEWIMATETDYFKRLCSISRAFAENLKKQEILDLIVDTAVEALDGKGACLFLDNREPAGVSAAAQKGMSPEYLAAATENAGGLMTDDLAKNGFILIPDVSEAQEAGIYDALKKEDIGAVLAVPVMVHQTLAGVLAFYAPAPRKFTAEEIALLTALADQGGIAIDRARLIEHIRRNSRLVHDLSVNINASLDFKQILSALTVDLGHAFNAKGVSVLLLDEDRRTLTPVASHGIDSDLTTEEVRADDATIRQTLAGETLRIKDVANHEGIFNPALYQKEKITTILSVPIRSGQAVSGILRLYFGTPKTFYNDEILLITAFANQAGLAIQNTACFLSLENDYKDLKDDLWSHRSWF
jgi:GAF domain-containing protein